MTFWDQIQSLETPHLLVLILALIIGFGFEFINGFHDTANAVTTVIYTKTMRPTPAVIFSGICNFLGVLLGGTAIAFSIVNLLPADLLVNATSTSAMVMSLSLLLSGVIWNLGTWALGLPVSSSHTLIGSILGVGVAHSVMNGTGLTGGVDWHKAQEVGLSLLISPAVGFLAAAMLLMGMKVLIRRPALNEPPKEGERPPWWARLVLITTCGGVSMAHGTNDGQKGMGLILLVLVSLMPAAYGLNLSEPSGAVQVRQAALTIRDTIDEESFSPQAASVNLDELRTNLAILLEKLEGLRSLEEASPSDRWDIRTAIFRVEAQIRNLSRRAYPPLYGPSRQLSEAIEYVPLWVILGVALSLGIGTTVGYKRIVYTVAEKIGKTHMTYTQGAAAEIVAAGTIGLASVTGLPVSTTHVLSSGVAGTMWANKSGVQGNTIRKIVLVWVFTLPASMALSATLFLIGEAIF